MKFSNGDLCKTREALYCIGKKGPDQIKENSFIILVNYYSPKNDGTGIECKVLYKGFLKTLDTHSQMNIFNSPEIKTTETFLNDWFEKIS